jgi:hypothetical protein
LGLAKISADAREGSRRDATLYAVGANASHGLKRTNRDKRNAVMVLLNDPEWGRRQDVRTADQIATALALIRQSDERRHGLAVWLSHSGMDRDPDLLDRLAARAARMEA